MGGTESMMEGLVSSSVMIPLISRSKARKCACLMDCLISGRVCV